MAILVPRSIAFWEGASSSSTDTIHDRCEGITPLQHLHRVPETGSRDGLQGTNLKDTQIDGGCQE